MGRVETREPVQKAKTEQMENEKHLRRYRDISADTEAPRALDRSYEDDTEI